MQWSVCHPPKGWWCPHTVPSASSAPSSCGSCVERAWEPEGAGGEAGVRAVIWAQRVQQGILTHTHRLSCAEAGSWSWLSVSSCELTPTERRTTKALSRATKCREVTQPERLPIISLHQQSRLLLFSLLCFTWLASWNWSTQICKLKPSRTLLLCWKGECCEYIRWVVFKGRRKVCRDESYLLLRLP